MNSICFDLYKITFKVHVVKALYSNIMKTSNLKLNILERIVIFTYLKLRHALISKIYIN